MGLVEILVFLLPLSMVIVRFFRLSLGTQMYTSAREAMQKSKYRDGGGVGGGGGGVCAECEEPVQVEAARSPLLKMYDDEAFH